MLFVSQQNDADVVAAALSNGAKGYVLKANANRELPLAVEAVLPGHRFIGSGVMPHPTWTRKSSTESPAREPGAF